MPVFARADLSAVALLCLVATARGFGAPAADHHFKVSSYGDLSQVCEGSTYRLADANLRIHAAGQPSEAMALQQLRAALAECGLHEASSSDKADLEIRLSLFVVERSEPEQGAFARFRPVTHRVHKVVALTEDDNGKVTRENQLAVLPVEDGYRPYNVRRDLSTVFTKSLLLAARTTGPASAELWRIEVRNNDACGDADVYLPLLFSAAIRVFESATAQTQNVVLSSDDRRAQQLKADS